MRRRAAPSETPAIHATYEPSSEGLCELTASIASTCLRALGASPLQRHSSVFAGTELVEPGSQVHDPTGSGIWPVKSRGASGHTAGIKLPLPSPLRGARSLGLLHDLFHSQRHLCNAQPSMVHTFSRIKLSHWLKLAAWSARSSTSMVCAQSRIPGSPSSLTT